MEARENGLSEKLNHSIVGISDTETAMPDFDITL
jgi:hypothetical protein